MIKQLKQFTVNLLAGANVVTVLLMVGTGYVDHLHPANHPLLSPLGMVFPLFLVFNLLFLLMWLIVKWRKMWIPIVGYLLAYVPISTYMPLNAKKDVPDGSIKMISYNVCCYGGNYKYEDAFERILDYFKQQDADIVLMLELAKDKTLNMWLRKNRQYRKEICINLQPNNTYSEFEEIGTREPF